MKLFLKEVALEDAAIPQDNGFIEKPVAEIATITPMDECADHDFNWE